MKIGKRILVVTAAVVLLTVVAAAVTFFWFTRRAHPQETGTITAEKLDAPVEVLRDEDGVPHIYAQTTSDLYFAQGFVHAQDRFWQMDFWRRIGAGRLSELLGEATISTDVFMRTLGFSELADREYKALSKEAREAVDAYAEGVNAYIDGRAPGELSLEHGILALRGVDAEPEPWRPQHTLTWLKIMAYDLGQNLQTELDTLRLIRAVGTELTRDFFPEYEEEMPYIVTAAELERSGVGEADNAGTAGAFSAAGEGSAQANAGEASARAPAARTERAHPERALAGRHDLGAALEGAKLPEVPAFGDGPGLGSNSWVIAGSRTESGMPILANDPHLGIQMPSIWYEVGLHSEEEDFDVAGFSFAGAPGVIVGHNKTIGWGVTNLAPDVQDVYIEQINPEDPTEYRVGDEWRDMEVRTEHIPVAGREEPHVIHVRETRHGPLITDLSSNARFRGFGTDVPRVSPSAVDVTEFSLRWTALEPNRTLESVYHLNRAENFDEFREALSMFDVPSQSFVYADVEGNIGYQAPGLIPIRRNGTGRLPVPGWTDEYEWEGYIPYEELPAVLNPKKDYIATANNPVVPPDYPYTIATEFNHGYRARRIVDMIEETEQASVGDVERMQGDVYSLPAEEVLPYVEELPTKGVLSRAQQMLSSWDRRMERESAEAALFALFIQNLIDALFVDQIPDELWNGSSRITEGSRVQSAIADLLESPNNRWWDDARTPEAIETRDAILMAALTAAIGEGIELFDGKKMSEWRWGTLHTAEFRNQSLGESGIGIIERLFNRGPVAVDGGLEQVLSADWDLTEPYEVAHLSSMRQILDFSNPDTARTIHTTGQSGHPFHRHYDDMIERWAAVEYRDSEFSRPAIEDEKPRVLILEPDL